MSDTVPEIPTVIYTSRISARRYLRKWDNRPQTRGFGWCSADDKCTAPVVAIVETPRWKKYLCRVHAERSIDRNLILAAIQPQRKERR